MNERTKFWRENDAFTPTEVHPDSTRWSAPLKRVPVVDANLQGLLTVFIVHDLESSRSCRKLWATIFVAPVLSSLGRSLQLADLDTPP